MTEQLIIGRYSKEREIGAGGMGTVYLGTDTVTGEYVAIKELKPDIIKDDPDIVERFAREAEALRKLNHPSIVKVLATAAENDRQYIIMEYVDGGSLGDRMEETPQMPVQDILNIALDLSDALTRAHRLHIIHRDIKPANVLIATDGTPRLTDFGVARIGDTTRLTKTGVVVGTLAYLAPEALNGERLDERADLWAFGVMLYEMLAGVRPFEGETTGAMLMKIMRDPTPDILQYRNYNEIGSWGLPGLIYWLLEKERDKRPQSARLVGAVLENLLTGKEMPMNWFGDDSGLYDDNPISLPPEKTAQAIREYTTSSLYLADLVSKNDELSGVDPAISTAKTVVDTPIAAPEKAAQRPTRSLMVSVAVVVLLAIIGVSALFVRSMGATPAAHANSVVIAPVEAGEYMVLIAEPERIEGETRDVQRFIADDLRFNLEDVPLSRIRIRTYSAMIRSADEAQRIADETNAHLILWGNYDSDRVEINVQMGDWEQFPKLVFPHDEVTAMVNARYQMANERQATLSHGVLAAFNALIPMSNGTWDMTRNLAILERLDEPTAMVQGNNIGALYHRYFANYTVDTASAVAYLDDAIGNDSNALLYMARALGYARLGNYEASRQDTATAQRLSPDPTWVSPQLMQANDLIYFQNDLAGAIPYLSTILENEAVHDDWFYWAYRGVLYYFTGNYEAAASDVERALALDPQANFAYLSALGLALRDADFETAQNLFNEVLDKFPDPNLLQRILLVTYNPEAADTMLVRYVSAFGNFTLKRWQAAIADGDAILALGFARGELYFLRGFAYCNLGDDAAAEAEYTAGIELDSSFTLLYFVRADVRRRQGNLIGAAQDIAAVLASPQSEQYRALINASTEGEVSCRTFLDMDLDALRNAEATPESNP
jgi:serine/threonine protein kinase/tetratricopeptide (TPR) repeat protein